MKQSIDVHWKELGAEFVNLDSDIQRDFFKGMAAELKTWPSNMAKECQAFEVAKTLTDDQKKELERFLICLWWTDQK